MGDYWLTRDLLEAAGRGYIALLIVALVLALWLPKRGVFKAGAAILVAVLFALSWLRSENENNQLDVVASAGKQRYLKAKALFEERCKTAGPKVYKTVEGVEGVFLKNIRTRGGDIDRADRMWNDAGLPEEYPDESYIRSFLNFEHHDGKRTERGFITNVVSDRPGYRFVDVAGTGDTSSRYRLAVVGESKLTKSITTGLPARYVVSFTNMVDVGDREFWVAGTTVTITDSHSNNVMAEHTWYSWEPGQGSTAGNRQPWGFAVTCPKGTTWGGTTTRMFVDQVLKPKLGN